MQIPFSLPFWNTQCVVADQPCLMDQFSLPNCNSVPAPPPLPASPPPLPQATTSLLLASMSSLVFVLLFLRVQVWVRSWYLSFCVWLTSLLIMFPRFVHVVNGGLWSFMAKQHSTVYTFHIFCVHSLDTHVNSNLGSCEYNCNKTELHVFFDVLTWFPLGDAHWWDFQVTWRSYFKVVFCLNLWTVFSKDSTGLHSRPQCVQFSRLYILLCTCRVDYFPQGC